MQFTVSFLSTFNFTCAMSDQVTSDTNGHTDTEQAEMAFASV